VKWGKQHKNGDITLDQKIHFSENPHQIAEKLAKIAQIKD